MQNLAEMICTEQLFAVKKKSRRNPRVNELTTFYVGLNECKKNFNFLNFSISLNALYVYTRVYKYFPFNISNKKFSIQFRV